MGTRDAALLATDLPAILPSGILYIAQKQVFSCRCIFQQFVLKVKSWSIVILPGRKPALPGTRLLCSILVRNWVLLWRILWRIFKYMLREESDKFFQSGPYLRSVDKDWNWFKECIGGWGFCSTSHGMCGKQSHPWIDGDLVRQMRKITKRLWDCYKKSKETWHQPNRRGFMVSLNQIGEAL